MLLDTLSKFDFCVKPTVTVHHALSFIGNNLETTISFDILVSLTEIVYILTKDTKCIWVVSMP